MVAEARSKRPKRICCPVWGSSMESLDSLSEMSSGTWRRLRNRERELKKVNPLLISLFIFPHSWVYLP